MAIYTYFSDSGDGWRNLATDDFFLRNLGHDDIMLYFYINDNAVIIGKSQNAWRECNLGAMEADGVQLVRRHTGGGAVFHDSGNLNFSFIMSEENYDLDRQMNVIKAAVAELGVNAERSGRNDMLADGRKFSGNAFAMVHGMRSHHGTLLISAELSRLANYLNVSEKKMHSKGIKSVRSRVCNLSEFDPEITVDRAAHAFRKAFEEEYGEAEPYAFDETSKAKVNETYAVQSSWEWRLGRTPEFDYCIEDRFSFGEIQLLLVLREGAVKDISVYSDALDTELADDVAARLRGVRFDAEAMADALAGDGRLTELEEHIRSLAL